MKHIKQSFIKRGFAFLLCTVLFSSSLFMSYGNTLTVKAVDESDLVVDALLASLTAIGVYVSGGTLSALALALGPQLTLSGKDIYDYVTDNGDGTTTISEGFVQLVLQSYNQYKEENGDMFDGTMTPGADGYYHFDSVNVSVYDPAQPGSVLNYSCSVTDIYTHYPCALLVYPNNPWGITGSRISGAFFVFYVEAEDKFYGSLKFFVEGTDQYDQDFGQAKLDDFFAAKSRYVKTETASGKVTTGEDYPIYAWNYSYGGISKTFVTSVSSSSIPTYHDLASLKEGLRTGDFSLAYNYGKLPDCETSKYTGSYSGGDITVTNEKLDGVLGKLDEISETDKSIDDKLKDLLDWLGIGDGSGGTGGGIAPSHWYDAVLDYLDKILKQLKSIKRWTIIDTFIDGVDAIADWLDLIHDILSDVDDGMESAVATLSSALNDATGLLKTKFPFSVPWDIFFFVTLLAAEPEVPHFELPIDFDVSALDMHVHYDFVLDFADYQYLSDISRVILSMTYAVGLLKMTSGIVSTKKEE